VKIGLFYELQTPRPWDGDREHAIIAEALEQVAFADTIGVDYIWAVEHHFLEEYSHCSAPEVFLAAASQRTTNVRLGHGIVLAPPSINHPARIAERAAMLDHVSNGRLDLGTGEGTSDLELEAFGLTRETKRNAWREGVDAVVGMLSDPVYPGTSGEFVQFPRRSVVPKPYQRPHPPLWMACNRREKIEEAARMGIGALNFSFGVKPDLAGKYVTAYRAGFGKGEPLGRAPNPNLAVVTGFTCTADADEAASGFRAMKFFMHAINYYFQPGAASRGNLQVAATFDEHGDIPNVDHNDPASLGIFGDHRVAFDCLSAYADSGVDQVILVAQAGGLDHRIIMRSLESLGREVIPALRDYVPKPFVESSTSG
jgi:alkanesulfonate monooxygenase SsuD/methylene tetrahydromethanopterin reductase-like flavin-dependent oxidoreductase (luciferase family)